MTKSKSKIQCPKCKFSKQVAFGWECRKVAVPNLKRIKQVTKGECPDFKQVEDE